MMNSFSMNCILWVVVFISLYIYENGHFFNFPFLLANVNSRSRSLYVIARPSVCRLSLCRLSVTFVHPTQAIEIFGNVSTLFGTFAIPDLSIKISRRSSQENPSVGG